MNHRFLIGFAEGVLFAAAIFAALVNYASAECFTTSRAVFHAHPGHDTHATWNMIDGRKCWYARGQKPGWENPSTEREVMRSENPLRATPRDDPRPRPASFDKRSGSLAGAVPMPRERPASPLTPKLVRTVAPPALAWPDTLTPADRAIETTGALPRTIQFDPLIEERAIPIPTVLLAEAPKPVAVIAPSLRARPVNWWNGVDTVEAILAVIAFVGLLTFFVGEIHRLLQMRAAKVAEAKR